MAVCTRDDDGRSVFIQHGWHFYRREVQLSSQSESLGLYISDLTCNIYLYCNTFRILRFDSISDRPKNTTFLQYYYFPMTIRISSLARFVSV